MRGASRPRFDATNVIKASLRPGNIVRRRGRIARALSVRFRRIVESEIDETHVTLRVVAGADGTISGRVSTLAYGQDGVELMSTEGADPPIATAVELAIKLAAFKEQDVDVVDPDGLWQPAWGGLDEG